MKIVILISVLALFVPAALAQTCSSLYGQCAGIGWTGPTCCAAGSVCTFNNAYYSQCLAGTAATTTTSSHTTTTTSHTTATTTHTTTTTSHTTTHTTTTTSHTTATTTTHTTATTTGGGTGFTPGPTPPTTNPFIGAKFYVNHLWTAEVANFVAADSTIACAQSELSGVSTAVWLDTISAISNMTWHLQQAAIQAAGSPIVIIFVIYDLPGRDCHALASNGEIPAGDDAEYKTSYIAPIVAILKANLLANIRVVLIIEPDSLPNGATNLNTMACTQAVISGYEADIAYAMSQLTMGNVWQYMDVGHGGWLGWPSPGLQNIGPILQGVLATTKSLNPLFFLRGWISNTANYDPWNSNTRPAKDPTATWASCNNYPIHPAGFTLCYDYNAAINEWIFQTEILGPTLAALGLTQTFLFDSSRSGQPGIRENWGSWCNINGAGIGPRPAATPDSTAPNLDAFVWIKPPGESDGNSAPLANHPAVDGFCDCTTTNGVDSLCPSPQAGQPFQAHFSMMVHNANPVLGTC